MRLAGWMLSAVLIGLCGAWIEAVQADDCATCGQPAFPEAAAFLAANGYPADQYTVLLSWQEAAEFAGTIVTGYHVRSVDGGAAFDLYSDGNGKLLTPADQARLGIRPKNWALPPVEQAAEFPGAIAKALPARPTPVGPMLGQSPGPVVALAPVDLQALLEEDAQSGLGPSKSAKRIGVVRSIPTPIAIVGTAEPTAGAWKTLADGSRLWSVAVQSPEARALRLHFAELAVPTGVRLIVYNSQSPNEAYGPYHRPLKSDRDAWSASCFGDSATVECYAPRGVALDGLKLAIDEVVHTYEDFGLLAWTKAAGTCMLDVSCHPEWTSVASGVCGFTFVSQPNQLHCTGTLLVDADPSTSIPYVLTANHCVSTQTGGMGASSMEFFWLYQTPSCNGTPPALADVPRTTGGADFLASVSSSNGSDFALVRLRSAPPEGVAFVGWSSDPPAVGTSVVAIHHPMGDFKRISFGGLTDTGSPQNGGSPLKPYDYFHEVHYSQGSTEPASSGCPLLLEQSQLVIGQLWGGYAACGKPEEPDYFGRFDQSFPVLASWLDPSISPYDVDASGSVNSVDVQLVVNAALGIPIRYNADVDRSGTVDAVDVQLVVLAVLNTP